MPVIAIGSAMTAPIAAADPKSANDFFKDGQTQYDLGNFNKAIEAFKRAYELDPKAAYIYNVAQSYRQLQDCKNALFFYKRFLALKADDTVKPLKPELRAEIDGRIAELEQCLRDQNKPTSGGGDKPPVDNGNSKPPEPPDENPITAPHHDKTCDEGGDCAPEEPVRRTWNAPKKIELRLNGGLVHVGAGPLSVPLQATFALSGGYPIKLGSKAVLDLGAAMTFTSVPSQTTSGASDTASLSSVLANVGLTYSLSPKWDLHGDLGIGALVFSGLTAGNPFTQNNAGTSGALSMINVRAAIAVEVSLTPRFFIGVTPIAIALSPPKAGLLTDISVLSELQFMAGVGVRM